MSAEQTDGFIPEGHPPFPSLRTDNGQVAEFSIWTAEALNGRIATYQEFIKTSELPHHQAMARRIIDHAIWELSYREGFYE
ncbi:MAG: hypothetical protein QFB87_04435 [Patescibacteria group bacterium]|nr:hypothetical protein [Patescibacteria group bacterium]